MEVYAKQIGDPTITSATDKFQNGVVGSLANYIMNASAESFSTEKFISNFNSTNKLGYRLEVGTNKADPSEYFTNIFRNNKFVGTVNYAKISNED